MHSIQEYFSVFRQAPKAFPPSTAILFRDFFEACRFPCMAHRARQYRTRTLCLLNALRNRLDKRFVYSAPRFYASVSQALLICRGRSRLHITHRDFSSAPIDARFFHLRQRKHRELLSLSSEYSQMARQADSLHPELQISPDEMS